MQKKRLSLLLLAALAWQCRAQMLVSSSDFLAAAQADAAVTGQAEHLRFMQEESPRLPFVDQIGLRTETDRFELRRQEYLTRVSLNGIKAIRENRLVQGASRNEAAAVLRTRLHEALAQRYDLFAELVLLQREADIRRPLLVVYEDKIRVLTKLAGLDTETDLDELIKTEYDRDELNLRLLESDTRIEQLKQAVQQQLTMPDTGAWQPDTSDFIRPLQLTTIATQAVGLPLQNPDIAEQEARIDRISAEYQLEKAKSRQLLDFVQLRYHNRPDEALNRDLSVGFGINLPYKGSARLKMSELKIENREAQLDRDLLVSNLAQKIAEATRRLEVSDAQYRLVQRQIQDSQAAYTLQQAQTGQAQPPLTLLRARELLLKRQLRLPELEREMFNQYLNILDWSGRLSEAPLVNYLSASLKQF